MLWIRVIIAEAEVVVKGNPLNTIASTDCIEERVRDSYTRVILVRRAILKA